MTQEKNAYTFILFFSLSICQMDYIFVFRMGKKKLTKVEIKMKFHVEEQKSNRTKEMKRAKKEEEEVYEMQFC